MGFQLVFPEAKKVYLIIDRTNWYWGKQKINIFMLGIAYEGLQSPILGFITKSREFKFYRTKSLIKSIFYDV